ncbi:MAG: hypothetical protein LBJ44_12170 [Propionibacteriaceae bacterium]|jgi:hypothetical protein|nr:hypothetical protein [Propionibacteriaceae bacterium]
MPAGHDWGWLSSSGLAWLLAGLALAAIVVLVGLGRPARPRPYDSRADQPADRADPTGWTDRTAGPARSSGAADQVTIAFKKES